MKRINLFLWIALATTISSVAYGSTSTGVAAGDDYTCAISTATGTGALYCWGNNASGQLGIGSVGNPSHLILGHRYYYTGYDSAQAVSGLGSGVTQVAASSGDDAAETTCAIANSNLYCWGDNTYGQVGNDSMTTSFDSPQGVYQMTGSGATVYSVSVGLHHACALAKITANGDSSAQIYCWGDGSHGEVRPGTTSGYTSPVKITDSNDSGSEVWYIFALQHDTCDVRYDGNVYCWGKDFWDEPHTSIYQLNVSDVTYMAEMPAAPQTGENGNGGAICVVESSGALLCEGYNWEHQLGIGATCSFDPGPTFDEYCDNPDDTDTYDSPPYVPENISGMQYGYYGAAFTSVGTDNYGYVSLNGSHACVTDYANADYFCTGDNAYGEVGDGTTGDPALAFTQGAGSLLWVTSGDTHNCGIGLDDNVYCWGNNYNGQLGTGNFTSLSEPSTKAVGTW